MAAAVIATAVVSRPRLAPGIVHPSSAGPGPPAKASVMARRPRTQEAARRESGSTIAQKQAKKGSARILLDAKD